MWLPVDVILLASVGGAAARGGAGGGATEGEGCGRQSEMRGESECGG
jgi:hypothetical protein